MTTTSKDTPISPRILTITLTAAVAAAGALSCAPSSTAATTTPTSSVAGSGISSFPPAKGSMFYGASEHGGDPILLENQTHHRLGADRGYYQASGTSALVKRAATDVAAGRLPVMSTKAPLSWRDMAAGKGDAWLGKLVDQLKAVKGPVVLSIHHEPENDTNGTTMTAATFKAMDVHVTSFIAKRGATNVWFGPILMSSLYNPVMTPNASRRLKATDWVSPKSGRIFMFDGYNHYSPNSGKKWRTVPQVFGSMISDFKAIDPSKPIGIAEYGVREDPANPTAARTWMDQAYSYSRSNGVSIMSYFSSDQNVNDGGTTWQLSGPRLTEFSKILAQPTSTLLHK